MNEKTIILISIFDGVVMLVMVALLFSILGEVRRDPLDVNRDGVADIIDLSVLAAEINERGK